MAEQQQANEEGPMNQAEWRAAVWRDIRETQMCIRESQMARAYAFPHSYAPDGRLREACPNHYMTLMDMHYSFRKSSEDLTLELTQVDEVGEPIERVKVGEVYSVDFFWTEYETIRLHIIATRPNHGMVVEHYQVFDLGRSGVAFTVSGRAWENWRQWAHEKVGGVHIDKRMVFLAIGDRSQIGNMSLDEFADLTCDQVEALTERMVPGLMLVRPSMEEAGLVEYEATPRTPPPVVELSSSSSSGSGSSKKPKGEKRKNVASNSRGTRGTFARGKARVSRPRRDQGQVEEEALHLAPDGKPLPPKVVENLKTLLTECILGHEEVWTVDEGKGEKEKDETIDVDDEVEDEEENTSDPPSGDDHFSVDDSGKETSICDISGVSSFQRESISTSSTDWMGPGPMPMNDSVEVFLAKKLVETEVVNISTDSSVLDVSKGQMSGITEMEI